MPLVAILHTHFWELAGPPPPPSTSAVQTQGYPPWQAPVIIIATGAL